MSELDEEYLTSFAREQQYKAESRAHSHEYGEPCPGCHHRWHGLACATCACPGAFREAS